MASAAAISSTWCDSEVRPYDEHGFDKHGCAPQTISTVRLSSAIRRMSERDETPIHQMPMRLVFGYRNSIPASAAIHARPNQPACNRWPSVAQLSRESLSGSELNLHGHLQTARNHLVGRPLRPGM